MSLQLSTRLNSTELTIFTSLYTLQFYLNRLHKKQYKATAKIPMM